MRNPDDIIHHPEREAVVLKRTITEEEIDDLITDIDIDYNGDVYAFRESMMEGDRQIVRTWLDRFGIPHE